MLAVVRVKGRGRVACWPMDQGDPVRKQEAHAPGEVRLTGKRERDAKEPKPVQRTGDHGRMIEPPRHERSRSSVQMSRRSVGRGYTTRRYSTGQ